MAAKLKLVTRASSGENRTVPLRRPNAELRQREYLTEDEVQKIIKAAKCNRYGQRDATMILTCYRHGLRASELCELRWSQVDWSRAHLHVKRLKGSDDSVHTVEGDEKRALRQLQREQSQSPLSSSPRSAAHPSRRQASLRWLSVPVNKRNWTSRCIRISCVTHAGSR